LTPPLAARTARAHWRLDQGRFKLTWRGLETLTLDTCLRPVTCSLEGKLYLRGLEGKVLEIRREKHGESTLHDARLVEGQEAEGLLRLWQDRLAEVLPEAGTWVDDLDRDVRDFHAVYPRPVSILPPDRYRAVVLQLTEGCSWNQCSFCNLYQDRGFKVKDAQAFEQHARQVRAYFGEALNWRQNVFLGDANAGSVSQSRFLQALEIAARVFPEFKGRTSCFMDTFSGRMRTVEDWVELRRAGLEQVNLGIESGHCEILKLLNKPADGERVRETVSRIKSAGLAASLIFLLGAGGKERALEHEQGTTGLLLSLPLGPADRVYFSELLIVPGRPYARHSLTPLDRLECREQARRIRQGLEVWDPPPRGPYVSLYDVRQFTYH